MILIDLNDSIDCYRVEKTCDRASGILIQGDGFLDSLAFFDSKISQPHSISERSSFTPICHARVSKKTVNKPGCEQTDRDFPSFPIVIGIAAIPVSYFGLRPASPI